MPDIFAGDDGGNRSLEGGKKLLYKGLFLLKLDGIGYSLNGASPTF
jgi:hypothetical protein